MYTGSIRRIRINGTPNRMGLIFLVLKAIADYGINIVTMEDVYKRQLLLSSTSSSM